MRSTFNSLFTLYKQTIILNCSGTVTQQNGLPYWQNRLFGSILIFFLPVSLLAVIPGIIMSIVSDAYFLAASDFLLVLLLAFITFKKNLSITIRKASFILVIYACAIVLLYFLGSYGPGLLYLMAVTIFTILIFERRIAYWTVVINVLICVLFGLSIYLQKINSVIVTQHSIGAWIAISSNLLFLSLIITALLPTIFKGLQSTIEEKEKLSLQLAIDQQSLEKSLQTVNTQNKELEEFAYMTSHDLQEPLRIVSSLLSQLEKKYAAVLDDKGLQYLQLAKDGSERMKRIIVDLLDYSLSEKKTYAIEPVDTNILLQEYVTYNVETLKEKNAALSWKDLPTIDADRSALQQLFQNLLGNSLKYQKKGEAPVIKISHQETKNSWEFAFSDNGIGINSEDFDKIFIVFKRLHDKNEYPGTGIGLAICKKIVENHKGKIWVESEQNNGSTFYFTISKSLT